jgi:transposase
VQEVISVTDGNVVPPALPTIWTVPDDLWEMVECLLDRFDPPNKRGRKRIDARRALNGMIYRMRTGCQWNHLPNQFGDDASVHRTQQRWEALGLFTALWGMVVSRCADLDGVQWQWQSADACLGKARGVPKRGRKMPASARIPQTAGKPVSRRACSSKQMAVL